MFALPAEKKWQIYCSKKKVRPLSLFLSASGFDAPILASSLCLWFTSLHLKETEFDINAPYLYTVSNPV